MSSRKIIVGILARIFDGLVYAVVFAGIAFIGSTIMPGGALLWVLSQEPSFDIHRWWLSVFAFVVASGAVAFIIGISLNPEKGGSEIANRIANR